MSRIGRLGLLGALMAAAGANVPEDTVQKRRDLDPRQKMGKRSIVIRRRDGSTEVVNPGRREKKALGLSGRQWRKRRKALRRADV